MCKNLLVKLRMKVIAICGRSAVTYSVFCGLFAGMTNALAFRPFHELSVYQRVWIVKSLCDSCAVCVYVVDNVSIPDWWHKCNCRGSDPLRNRGINMLNLKIDNCQIHINPWKKCLRSLVIQDCTKC